ncbi:MAG: hypothetical protein P4L87_08085 [Formivibrio sp.]|nr:hypothetical protein [Formivibrio sp.]
MLQVQEVNHYAVQLDEKGQPYTDVALTSTDNTTSKNVLAPANHIIPIVFIPGIMGTNLKNNADGKPVWQPPSTDGILPTLDAILQLLKYAVKSASDRQEELNADKVGLYLDGPIDPGISGLSKDICRQRGWGALMRASYHPVMGQLQHHLNNIMELCQLQGWWQTNKEATAADYGDILNGGALTENELIHAAHYRFEVWAGGYNWLKSNGDSGKAIQEYIEKTVLPFYKGTAEKVIVVTHSMGGLVSRALTEVVKSNLVLGVVHGVQPASGAPATYKRIRAGFEGPDQLILGRDAADCTAIMANAPGPLELLPFADYNQGKPWLKVRDKHSKSEKPLPVNDPYQDIYMSDKWYGLIPVANEGLMDPATIVKPALPMGRSLRTEFKRRIGDVMNFHRLISEQYHKLTYVHYGAETSRKCWLDVFWEGSPGDKDIGDFKCLHDDLNDTITLDGNLKLTIAAPDAAGDGTVPLVSAQAQKLAKGDRIKAVFEHGTAGQGQHNTAKGYDHQSSYNDPRSVYATLYGIIKIAQEAKWATS